MGVQTFLGKVSQGLLWASSRATRVKITIRGVPIRLGYCVHFTIYTYVI